jgi:hypothetical protein
LKALDSKARHDHLSDTLPAKTNNKFSSRTMVSALLTAPDNQQHSDNIQTVA